MTDLDLDHLARRNVDEHAYRVYAPAGAYLGLVEGDRWQWSARTALGGGRHRWIGDATSRRGAVVALLTHHGITPQPGAPGMTEFTITYRNHAGQPVYRRHTAPDAATVYALYARTYPPDYDRRSAFHVIPTVDLSDGLRAIVEAAA